jgi:protein arginine kinase
MSLRKYKLSINKLLVTSPSWINKDKRDSEIVLTSRVRLARNLKSFKFPHRADENELKAISDFLSFHITPISEAFFSLSQLSLLQLEVLMERRLISRELWRRKDGQGIYLFDKESLFCTVNEEDHIWLQAISSGLNLKNIYEKVNEIDNQLSNSLSYAFSTKFGYLTASPTNLGTGLSASVLLHLPALVHSGKIRKIVEKLAEKDFLVSGVYGGFQEVEGNIFQISTQISLGKKEEEIIDSLHEITIRVIKHETEARDILWKNARLQVEDKIWRAYAILKKAKLLSFSEFINLSSAVRLGIGFGMIKDIEISKLNRLLIFTQTAHLQNLMGKTDDSLEIDRRRAWYVRENMQTYES